MIIVNYSFKEYSLLTDEERLEFDLIIEHGKEFNESIDVFNIGELTEKGFGIVKDIQYSLNNGITWKEFFEYLEQLTNVNQNDLQNKSMLDLIRFRNYLMSEIKRINELESILLSYTPTADEERAGVEEFEKLGAYMQIRSLTGGDITKVESVRNIKYTLCLVELRTQKLLSDYQNSLNEIYLRKNKIN